VLLRGPDDATTRYLEKVAEDILVLLGPGIELESLAVEVVDQGTVGLRAQYTLAGLRTESVAQGENVIEAHARLRSVIVEDRLGLGLRLLT
jgi:hypothetical protein